MVVGSKRSPAMNLRPALPVRPADILIDLGIVCALHLLRVPLKRLAHASECRQITGQDPLGEPAGRSGEVVGERTTLLDCVEYLIERSIGSWELSRRQGELSVFLSRQDACVDATPTPFPVPVSR